MPGARTRRRRGKSTFPLWITTENFPGLYLAVAVATVIQGFAVAFYLVGRLRKKRAILLFLLLGNRLLPTRILTGLGFKKD
jgi:hypothetical protein